MKKGAIEITLFLLIFIFPCIAGASLSPIDSTVTILDEGAPLVRILSPLNTTYNNATPISVNYSIMEPNLDSIWYSLNSQPNITITNSFFLSLAEGNYHIIIYANDSTGAINNSEVYFNTRYTPLPYCGDGSCNAEEDCNSCEADCGECEEEDDDDNNDGPNQEEPTILPASFVINKNSIRIPLKQGETKTEQLTITNDGERAMSVRIELPYNLRMLVKLSQEEFSLEIGESKTINIIASVDNNMIEGIYAGKMTLIGGIVREVSLALEVESSESLFDVSMKVNEEDLKINPNETMNFNLSLTRIGKIEEGSVLVKYFIKDEAGNILFSTTSTEMVGSFLELSKEINIPPELLNGKYLLYVEIAYDGKIANTSSWFDVLKEIPPPSKITLLKPHLIKIGIGIILLVILIIIYLKRKSKKKLKVKKTLKNKPLKKVSKKSPLKKYPRKNKN